MDMREAYEDWWENGSKTPGKLSDGKISWQFAIWRAACEWQKQKDAEVAVFMKFDEQEEWVNDCEKVINQYLEVVKKDILNQGKDNG